MGIISYVNEGNSGDTGTGSCDQVEYGSIPVF